MLEKPCSLCGHAARPTLADRPDREYGVPHRLDYWACAGCGLVFADPIPVAQIADFYREYSTHAAHVGHAGDAHDAFWRIVERLSPPPDRKGAFATLGIARNARILDFGCGSGSFIHELMAYGYRNVAGCDFDPNVAARSIPGVRFFEGIDTLVQERFDIITLNHVIEHLPDPVGTLRRLAGHLESGGVIQIRTPNVASNLARYFGENWRGWETPRHLYLFTPEALRLAVAAADLALRDLVTSNDMRAGMFIGSLANTVRNRLVRRAVTALAYVPMAWALHHRLDRDPLSGEEIVALIEPR